MIDEAKLAEWEQQAAVEPGMHSGCSDYACYCHFRVPELVAEVRRLRAMLGEAADEIEHWGGYADDYFKKKWGLAEAAARFRAAASPAGG